MAKILDGFIPVHGIKKSLQNATCINNEIPTFDIVILGGGIVGTICAHLLAMQGLHIAVLEQQKFLHFNPKVLPDARISSLNLASINILKQLDIWPELNQQRLCAFQHMRVFEAYGSGEIAFDAIDIGEIELGFTIENNYLLSILIEKLNKISHVKFYTEIQPHSITVKNDCVELTFEKKQKKLRQKICGRLLIGADGAHSWVRQYLKIPSFYKSYQQTAIVTHINTERPHSKTAWQWFWPNGPIAFLPLPDPHMCSIVWSVIEEEGTILMQNDASTFAKKLEYASLQQLGKITSLYSRYTFPLFKQSAQRYIDERIALIGDAAHTIHPLAGQGINLGILDAVKIANVIKNAHTKQRDFGKAYVLRRFERASRPYNEGVSIMMDGFHYLFNNKNLSLMLLRHLGLHFCNQSAFKLFLMRQAVGSY